ncbi:MAG: PH domain-containing protein [Actinomycetales bacterium]|nr:MAG: PH domain-containing protein [Actinomycetales bacterium]
MPGLITYRPGGTRIVAYGSCVALAAITVVITVSLPADIRAQVTFSQAVTLFGTILAMMAVLHGMGRSYVRVDDDTITVVNGFRKHVLAWDDVQGVALPEGAPWPTLVTNDDDRVMLFAIQASSGKALVREAAQDIARRAGTP